MALSDLNPAREQQLREKIFTALTPLHFSSGVNISRLVDRLIGFLGDTLPSTVSFDWLRQSGMLARAEALEAPQNGINKTFGMNPGHLATLIRTGRILNPGAMSLGLAELLRGGWGNESEQAGGAGRDAEETAGKTGDTDNFWGKYLEGMRERGAEIMDAYPDGASAFQSSSAASSASASAIQQMGLGDYVAPGAFNTGPYGNTDPYGDTNPYSPQHNPAEFDGYQERPPPQQPLPDYNGPSPYGGGNYYDPKGAILSPSIENPDDKRFRDPDPKQQRYIDPQGRIQSGKPDDAEDERGYPLAPPQPVVVGRSRDGEILVRDEDNHIRPLQPDEQPAFRVIGKHKGPNGKEGLIIDNPLLGKHGKEVIYEGKTPTIPPDIKIPPSREEIPAASGDAPRENKAIADWETNNAEAEKRKQETEAVRKWDEPGAQAERQKREAAETNAIKKWEGNNAQADKQRQGKAETEAVKRWDADNAKAEKKKQETTETEAVKKWDETGARAAEAEQKARDAAKNQPLATAPPPEAQHDQHDEAGHLARSPAALPRASSPPVATTPPVPSAIQEKEISMEGSPLKIYVDEHGNAAARDFDGKSLSRDEISARHIDRFGKTEKDIKKFVDGPEAEKILEQWKQQEAAKKAPLAVTATPPPAVAPAPAPAAASPPSKPTADVDLSKVKLLERPPPNSVAGEPIPVANGDSITPYFDKNGEPVAFGNKAGKIISVDEIRRHGLDWQSKNQPAEAVAPDTKTTIPPAASSAIPAEPPAASAAPKADLPKLDLPSLGAGPAPKAPSANAGAAQGPAAAPSSPGRFFGGGLQRYGPITNPAAADKPAPAASAATPGPQAKPPEAGQSRLQAKVDDPRQLDTEGKTRPIAAKGEQNGLEPGDKTAATPGEQAADQQERRQDYRKALQREAPDYKKVIEKIARERNAIKEKQKKDIGDDKIPMADAGARTAPAAGHSAQAAVQMFTTGHHQKVAENIAGTQANTVPGGDKPAQQKTAEAPKPKAAGPTLNT